MHNHDSYSLIRQRPSQWVSWPVCLGLALVWGVIRLIAFHDVVMPLTYVLPLLVCIWARDRLLLWTMAVIFVIFATIEMFHVLPTEVLPSRMNWAVYGVTLINIGIGGLAMHLILLLRERLEASLIKLANTNEVISQQNEELQAQSEELAQQSEEIQAQSEELSQQNEELTQQYEALQRTEEALREKRDRLALAMDSTGLGWWDYNLRTGQVLWDEQFKAAWGVTQDALRYEEIIKVIHPEDQPRVDQAVRESVSPEFRKPYDIEYRVIRPDGSVRWVAAKGRVFFDDHSPSHSAIRFIGTVMDITIRKQAEEALRTFNEELEQRVRDRTAELLRSNEDLERFAYISSHDLQEPLRMVTSFVQLLEQRCKDKLDEDGRAYIRFAVEGAQRMSTLIKDLLTYSRVNTHAQSPEPVDCGILLQQVLQNLSLRLEETKGRVTYDSLPTVMADPTQLSQVFQNLIDNALKFRREGQPPHVHVASEERDGQYVFSVKDDGIGIDPQYAEKVFVIFQRLHADRGKYPGTGIGLAIVKRIIERHGGSIKLESAIGKGSTFVFTVPKQGGQRK